MQAFRFLLFLTISFDLNGEVAHGGALCIGILALSSESIAADKVVLSNSADALPGIGRVLLPGPLRTGIGVALTGGYGYTESVLDAEDSHHRAFGTLSASVRATEWLGFALRYDGRYDQHNQPDRSDDSYVGDPLLLALTGFEVARGLRVGGRLALLLPGGAPPSSLPFSAASFDLAALFSYTPKRSALTLALNAGFRIDRSDKAVDEPDRVSRADRLALGLSSSNAIPLGLGATYRIDDFDLLAEWFWDLHVGDEAPGAMESPMHVALGARYRPAELDTVELEALAFVSPSGRPTIAISEPLVPVEPRFGFSFGVRLTPSFGQSSASDEKVERLAAELKKIKGLMAKTVTPPIATCIAKGVIVGQVRSITGSPLAAQVFVETGTTTKRHTANESGRFVIAKITPGPVALTIRVTNYHDINRSLTLKSGQVLELDLEMARSVPAGEIRGTVRSIKGDPIPRAKIAIEPGNLTLETDEKGAFRTEVPPRRYTVTVEADGHRKQKRPVKVELNGVSVLNVDLREKR